MNEQQEADALKLVALTKRLLLSVEHGDWDAYSELCSTDMTSFQPETGEHMVIGRAFQKFCFRFQSPSVPNPNVAYASKHNGPATTPPTVAHTTILSPHVRFLHPDRSCALVTYVRLTQVYRGVSDSKPIKVSSAPESRVWVRKEGSRWQAVHVHRSPGGSQALPELITG